MFAFDFDWLSYALGVLTPIAAVAAFVAHGILSGRLTFRRQTIPFDDLDHDCGDPDCPVHGGDNGGWPTIR